MKGHLRMTIKQAAKKPALLKIKTGLKAGDHCRDAFRDFINHQNHDTRQQFMDCCQKDRKCLQ